MLARPHLQPLDAGDVLGSPAVTSAPYHLHVLPRREGGTKGVSIVASPLLEKKNYTYHGLAHAVDWLPTLVAGVLAGSTASTKPLDGHDLWAALLSGDPGQSTRADVYKDFDIIF